MKKVIYSSLLLLSTVTLAACSSSSPDSTASSSSSTEQTSSSSTVASTAIDNSQYDAIVEKLNSELNPDGSAEFEAEIINDVVDSEYPDGHNVIRILFTGQAKTSIEEIVAAIDSNTATADQQNAIALLQMVISQMAKELPDDTTTIDLGYEISADQYHLIAKSSKIKDIIPINDLVME
ncbi:TPA: hypothetical protein ACHVAC_000959 [Streptococcus suis]|nr:hypothetical protein [Streptococcus suis]MCK4057803.1 hypothetical protein [Streptococcus suis]HEL2560114.1 hypothetical protein [Streptococcus suis]HEL2613020.1 hypothetical protein [Streptococcus suis]HEM2564821.1 hypothetical protein [Streptococcus suis]